MTLRLFLALWTAGAVYAQTAQFEALNVDAGLTPEKLASEVASKRVVFVGEAHDRYDNHLNQLEIIRRLRAMDPKIAIGVEYFQARFQGKVDDYIDGKISEQEFLRDTDYFDEWGYDYRLYAPIFRFAREQKIPVRALNVPTAVVSAVSRSGLAGLTPQQRDGIPQDIEPADDAYKARLRESFEGHGSKKPGAFDHFVEAQLTWDESMAANAASYLNGDPNRRMVILTGSGHLEFGSGIPKRLERRTHASYAIVLNNGGGDDAAPHVADYVLLSKEQDLPPAGTLGVSLETKEGECRVSKLSPGGAAQQAGIEKGDTIVDVDSQPIKKPSDVRLLLWDRKPGDRVMVTIRRKHWSGTQSRKYEIELKAAPKG